MFQLPDDLATRSPDHSGPCGPAWEVDGEAIGLEPATRPFLVRRLDAAAGMLSTAAVLGHAAKFDHPQCISPTAWVRHDDEVWIATPRPAGVRLAEAELGRLSWSEAMELWRPLAEALHTGHRRGVVHGNIHPWSLWFDDALHRLVVVDAGTWIGDAFPTQGEGAAWWPAELAAEPASRAPSTATDIATLARLLLFLTLPREEAESHSPNMEGVPAYVIPAIERALRARPDERPQRVSELVSATSPAPLRAHALDADPRAESADILYGRVFGNEELQHPKWGRGVRFWISHPDYVETGDGDDELRTSTIGSFFYEGANPALFDSVKWAWEGAEINLLSASRIEDSGGRAFLTGGPETLPVLEPHWPVSVTDVLKAEGCVSRFLVDQRDFGERSEHLVFGNLVHGMLDDLAGPDPPPFEACFEKRARELRLDMLACGLVDADMERFERKARAHFANIEGFARGRDTTLSRAGWTGENVEVTRYSTVYGLEGRIDLVTEDERAGLQIVELKSGSVRDEHLSQVRSYGLLWQGVADKRELPISGQLLYSRDGKMRSAPVEDAARERRILRARNALVACHKKVADGAPDYRAPAFMDEPSLCNGGPCRFRKSRCAEQTEILGLKADADPVAAGRQGFWKGADPRMVSRAWAWWRHFTRLVEMERWAANEAMGAVLQSGRLAERIANYRAVGGLRIAHVDAGSQQITFEGDRPGRVFTPGDYIVAHRGDFHRSHILRGKYVDATADTLTLWTQGAPNADSLERDGWILDVLPARIGHREAHQALYEFLRTRHPGQLGVVLAPDSERSQAAMSAAEPVALDATTVQALNPSQQEAVQRGLSAPVGCLVQGPPGTGKTTVIAHLVRELVARGKRVVVAALTNTAVDTMLEKIYAAGVPSFLRVGPSSRSTTLAARIKAGGDDPARFFTGDLGRSASGLDALGWALQQAPVIGCTTHRAMSDSVMTYLQKELGPVPFDVAIVDEATQLTEPMTLAPLRLAKRFVLVGDHRQLPPIVTNEQATTGLFDGYSWPSEEEAQPELLAEEPRSETEAMGVGGLDRSLFERLITAGLPYVLLDEQYRMHASIMAFSNRRFYEGRLRAHRSVAEAELRCDAGALDRLEPHVREAVRPDTPVVFAHVEGEGEGRLNAAEADAVVDTIIALRAACDVDGKRPNIGVISPFRAQVQLIRNLLERRLGDEGAGIDVDTVERYQGSERDVILVSLVKTDRPGDFLSDERRLNVTLTRARRKLVLFGHHDCLVSSPLYRALIEGPEVARVHWPSGESKF